MKLAVIGAGSWGTAIAGVLGQQHEHVVLWARNEALVKQMREARQNQQYLPDVNLPITVSYSENINEAVANAHLIVIATPSQAVRATAGKIAKSVAKDALILTAAKGLELPTLKRMSQVIAETIPASADRIAALSGPSHAEEVGLRFPTTTVVASPVRQVAEKIQDLIMLPYFRVYTNPDIIGVELGGAFKNIIALGAGMIEGLGFGDNTKAALMTRGLAEISRLGIAMGAQPLTFAGLSGVGDLIVTCTSRHSRNCRAGILLAQGKTVQQVETESNMVVEGIKATQAAYELSKQLEIEMPITEQIFLTLYEGKSPREAVADLMTRVKTHEVEEVVFDKIKWK
ncbi:MAG: NAD(P)H-dependent glycerol-3-phosphate dehydrogenase [Veillonellales bacterium]